jgi:hypothetical protein
MLRSTRALVVFSIVLSLSACGGGGGGSSPPPMPSVSFSTSSVSFQADGPYSPAPANQTITGTTTGVTSGTLYIVVIENNPDVVTVTNIVQTTSTSGQATIVPGNPATLLSGHHTGSLTVKACLNDSTCATGQLAGSPQTISVSYDVGSTVDADTVSPRMVVAGASGNVILRGHGFTSSTTVTFGSTPAATASFVSDTEIHASYPPLAAGTYPISLSSGSVAYAAVLTAYVPPTYSAAFLAFTGVGKVTSIEYDAQRSAIFVVQDATTLVRYAFDGQAWSAPTQVDLPGLQQVRVSPDGTKLLALINTVNPWSGSMAELDPVTLAPGATTAFPGPIGDPTEAHGSFALANDGNALVNSDEITSGLVYGTASKTFKLTAGPEGGGVSNGDGSIVAFGGSRYIASTGAIQSPFPVGQAIGNAGFFTTDFAGDRFASGGGILDGNGQILGYPAGSSGAAVNLAGTRVYNIEDGFLDPSNFPMLHVLDITQAPTTGQFPQFPEIGTPIALAGNPNNDAQLLFAFTPDGGTLFIVGTSGIAVQPLVN